jgi:T3SS (YopN, CesT) and YbjN peptide-binding chaperone 1
MSMRIEWLGAYVAMCLRESWGDDADHLVTAGHVTHFRVGTAACQVRVEDGDPTMVRVMAVAVTDVRSSAKLLREVNEVNAHARVANVWWYERDVVVECSLFAESVTVETLEQACQQVASVANDIGVGMAALYDGSTPYPPFVSDSEDAA